MSKNFSKIHYNNINKPIGDNKKKANFKKLLSKTMNINFNNNVINSNKKKSNKKKSYHSISELELPPEKIKEKNSDLSEEKLTIKTTLIKSKEKQYKNIENEELNKYHINFELLSNAGINDDININIAFI